MSTITYNIDSIYNESLFKEIEEICNKPVRFFYEIQVFILDIKTKKLVKKCIKSNAIFAKSLDRLDYADLKKYEEKVVLALTKLTKHAKACDNCPFTDCKNKYLDIFFNPLIESFANLAKAMNDSYHFHANDLYKSEEDFKKYNDPLKSFADFWDDEVPEEDKEFVFNFNKESTHAL